MESGIVNLGFMFSSGLTCWHDASKHRHEMAPNSASSITHNTQSYENIEAPSFKINELLPGILFWCWIYLQTMPTQYLMRALFEIHGLINELI